MKNHAKITRHRWRLPRWLLPGALAVVALGYAGMAEFHGDMWAARFAVICALLLGAASARELIKDLDR